MEDVEIIACIGLAVIYAHNFVKYHACLINNVEKLAYTSLNHAYKGKSAEYFTHLKA